MAHLHAEKYLTFERRSISSPDTSHFERLVKSRASPCPKWNFSLVILSTLSLDKHADVIRAKYSSPPAWSRYSARSNTSARAMQSRPRHGSLRQEALTPCHTTGNHSTIVNRTRTASLSRIRARSGRNLDKQSPLIGRKMKNTSQPEQSLLNRSSTCARSRKP